MTRATYEREEVSAEAMLKNLVSQFPGPCSCKHHAHVALRSPALDEQRVDDAQLYYRYFVESVELVGQRLCRVKQLLKKSTSSWVDCDQRLVKLHGRRFVPRARRKPNAVGFRHFETTEAVCRRLASGQSEHNLCSAVMLRSYRKMTAIGYTIRFPNCRSA